MDEAGEGGGDDDDDAILRLEKPSHTHALSAFSPPGEEKDALTRQGAKANSGEYSTPTSHRCPFIKRRTGFGCA